MSVRQRNWGGLLLGDWVEPRAEQQGCQGVLCCGSEHARGGAKEPRRRILVVELPRFVGRWLSDWAHLQGARHKQVGRADIEKTFDELKNKLAENKAWASSANAKTMQAHFLCMAHNLMVLFEAHLDRTHGIRNEAEIKRRTQRLNQERTRLAEKRQSIPTLYYSLQRFTQRSLKFIRWLRVQLFSNPGGGHPIDALRRLFATL